MTDIDVQIYNRLFFLKGNVPLNKLPFDETIVLFFKSSSRGAVNKTILDVIFCHLFLISVLEYEHLLQIYMELTFLHQKVLIANKVD